MIRSDQLLLIRLFPRRLAILNVTSGCFFAPGDSFSETKNPDEAVLFREKRNALGEIKSRDFNPDNLDDLSTTAQIHKRDGGYRVYYPAVQKWLGKDQLTSLDQSELFDSKTNAHCHAAITWGFERIGDMTN